jgi:thiamine pyrophosphate-dependent acetolactate synthase large subunit-like protein
MKCLSQLQASHPYLFGVKREDDNLQPTGLTMWAGVDFGPVDVVKYAEAFGAIGFMVDAPDQIRSRLKKAFGIPGPVLIGIRVDYRDNHKLFEEVHEHLLN